MRFGAATPIGGIRVQTPWLPLTQHLHHQPRLRRSSWPGIHDDIVHLNGLPIVGNVH